MSRAGIVCFDNSQDEVTTSVTTSEANLRTWIVHPAMFSETGSTCALSLSFQFVSGASSILFNVRYGGTTTGLDGTLAGTATFTSSAGPRTVTMTVPRISGATYLKVAAKGLTGTVNFRTLTLVFR